MADIKTVLTELLKTITAEVNKPEIQQMSFKEFSTSEQLQFEHNLSALEARVQQIPAEIEQEQEQEQEQALIARRYSDPTSRLFPVTVTYFVPSQVKKISPLARSSSKCRQ